MIKEFLFKSSNSNILVGIRTSAEEWNQAIIGFITDVNEKSVILNEVDKNGLLIGNTTILLDDIISLDFDDRYQRRLHYIHDCHKSLNANKQITIWQSGDELIKEFNMLISLTEITTFYFDEGNYVVGFLLEVDTESILVKNIGIEGDEDGISYHRINKIIGIKYAGIDEQKIKMLYEKRETFY